ncbi:hypothetical protein Aab01nite_55810 [Paractinoplanes abujensis]|uniref:Uncharacterized protein n=1 Tax=Paractinoplanes abujensis TaxID=882441 RepID=A0A7W7CWZ4_9ACTN|nr:hypothetical protein [Actinoplanes abujensis]MBB4696004.1 hypothetical protein [Actinoplanes abujensis]GID21991.1 hypothetical protein Aab01nite_55810 [Actinoplanes abujensis]
MTSEGHYAGSQPAEATSGGPTSDGFPPDTDGQRVSARASAQPPADGFPTSYGPPPQATPNGGSPFVVPVVPTFGQGPDAPRPATGTSYGSARVPGPDDNGNGLPQRTPAPAPEGNGLPQRGAASPYGSVSPGNDNAYGSATPPSAFGPSSVFGAPPSEAPQASAPSAAEPQQPPTGWAPTPAPPARTPPEQNFIQRPGAPLPQRNANPAGTVDSVEGFNGFAAPAGRGAPEQQQQQPQQQSIDPSTGRPPGISAFGDQRVRVPGATLTGLPDAPPPAQTGDSGGFPLRGTPGSGGSAFPTRGGGGSGFPLRGTPGSEPATPATAAPSGELPVRGQQGPFGPPPGAPQLPPASSDFSAFGPASSGPAAVSAENAPHPYGRPEPLADPFGRNPDGQATEGRPAPGGTTEAERGSLPDPFGRSSGEAPVAGVAYGSARPPAQFGPSDDGSADAAFGTRPSAPDSRSAGSSDSAAFGSARPAGGPFGTPEGDSGAYGSARPFGQPEGDSGAYGSARPAGGPFGAPADDHGSARPADPFGRPDSDNDGRPTSPASGSARPAGGPFGTPEGDSGAFGSARPFGDAAAYGSARPTGESDNNSGAAHPYGRSENDQNAFGTARPAGGPFGTPEGDSPAYGSARPAGGPFGASEGDSGSARPADPYGDNNAFGTARPTSPASGSARPFGASEGDSGAYGSARPAGGPFGQPEGGARPTSPAAGSARPAGGPFGAPDGSSSPFGPVQGEGQGAQFGSAFGGGRQDDNGSQFGPRPGSPEPESQSPAQPPSPFGVVREPGAAYGAARPASPFGPGGDDQSGEDAHAPYRRPESPAENNGYPQRVPGAAFGSPAAADNRNGSVPAPRDPSENAVGSARPVTASASVPTTNRTAPVEASEVPPPSAAPQARVYGRPAATEPAVEDEQPPRDSEPSFGADSPFGPRPGNDRPAFGGDSPFGGHPGDSPFGNHPDDDRPEPATGGHGASAYGRLNELDGSGDEPDLPGIAPQSPARASARASASARVSLPGPGGPGNPPTGMASAPALPGAAPEPASPGSPYADRPGGDRPGGGRPGEPYSELTTDIAGREQPFVPAPALPPMPPGLNGFDPATQPRSNGFGPPGQQPPNGFGPGNDGFPNQPGPASRATVTPPTPEETTSWPGVEADQGRFDSFKAEEKPAKPATPHVRMLPILISVIIAAVLLLGIGFGIVYLVAGGNDKSLSVIQGECVKREGDSAVKAECSESGSYQVASIVPTVAECADPGQPHVINKASDGKQQVLCLKANG